MGLPYMPIRPGVVPGGSMGRQSYGIHPPLDSHGPGSNGTMNASVFLSTSGKTEGFPGIVFSGSGDLRVDGVVTR